MQVPAPGPAELQFVVLAQFEARAKPELLLVVFLASIDTMRQTVANHQLDRANAVAKARLDVVIEMALIALPGMAERATQHDFRVFGQRKIMTDSDADLALGITLASLVVPLAGTLDQHQIGRA